MLGHKCWGQGRETEAAGTGGKRSGIAVGMPVTRHPPQSGRTEARSGLRMMPTFPRSPLSFRTAGFPQYGWKAGISSGAFPMRRAAQACSRHTRTLAWFASALRASRGRSSNPVLSRVADSTMHRLGGWVVLRPRGPRSGSGYAVPIRQHLIGPIRPTRRYIAISPHAGLYAMPSLCGSAEAPREWFPAIADHSFLACRAR